MYNTIFFDNEHLIGNAAKNQVAMDPHTTGVIGISLEVCY